MSLQLSRLFFLSIAFIFALIMTLLWILSTETEGDLLMNEHHHQGFKDTVVGQEINNRQNSIKSVSSNNMSPIQWKDVNLLEKTLPQSVDENAKKVVIEHHRIKVQGHDVFYRKAAPPGGVAASRQEVLLLHGKNFKSQTWLELSTIQSLAAMGHKVTAIDIPGYGESSKEHVPEPERGEFLHRLILLLNLQRPVVVSPSLSGSFTVPLLRSHPEQFGGYVPVAPIMTGLLNAEQYKKVKIPTLIIYGENDKSLGEESRGNLGNIPTSQVQMLSKAGHAAYLDQPEVFHQLLYNFLNVIESSTN